MQCQTVTSFQDNICGFCDIGTAALSPPPADDNKQLVMWLLSKSITLRQGSGRHCLTLQLYDIIQWTITFKTFDKRVQGKRTLSAMIWFACWQPSLFCVYFMFDFPQVYFFGVGTAWKSEPMAQPCILPENLSLWYIIRFFFDAIKSFVERSNLFSVTLWNVQMVDVL